MPWPQIIFMIISAIISYALRPKPPEGKASTLEDFSAPTASQDRPIPVIFGRVRISGPNVVWYGDLRSDGFHDDTRYKYFIGMHMVLCHGPINAIEKIEVDERVAWDVGTTGGPITIDANKLFGGRDEGGGVSGTVDIDMGASDQTPNTYLSSKLGDLVPAFRGVVSAVLNQTYIGVSDYLKPWAFWAVRNTIDHAGDPIWNAADAVIGDHGDMNPAHMIRECLIADQWGMGYTTSSIDDPSFQAAADQFLAEGFGLSAQWLEPEPIEDFIQRILDHVGASLNLDPTTGLFRLDLMRDDYVLSEQPVFDESNVLEVTSFERRGWGDTINEVVVSYKDWETGEDKSVTLQNLANVQVQGRVVSQNNQYPMIRSSSLAARVCQRDLSVLSSPLAKLEFKVNREAWDNLPGSVFSFNWGDYDLTGVAFRILSVDTGTQQDNVITMAASEDYFGLPSGTYWEEEPPGWVDPNDPPPDSGPDNPGDPGTGDNPDSIKTGYVLEMPYWEVNKNRFSESPPGYGYLMSSMARQGLDGIVIEGVDDSQLLLVSHTGTAVEDFYQAADGSYTQYAETMSALAKENLTVVTCSPGYGGLSIWDPESEGDGWIYPWPMFPTSDILLPCWVLIDGTEIAECVDISITLFSDPQTYDITLNRGVLDTTPLAHSSGVPIVFSQTRSLKDLSSSISGETAYAKILGETAAGWSSFDNAILFQLDYQQRAERPYPPGYFRINNSVYPASVGLEYAQVAWRHRDRLLQVADYYGDTGNILHHNFIEQTASYSIGPEGGTKYRVQLYNVTRDEPVDYEVGITGELYFARLPTNTLGVHRYWRLKILTPEDDNSAHNTICEVEFRATSGGADLCTGGTPLSSTNTADAGLAFDDLNTTVWESDNGDRKGGHIGYFLLNSSTVVEVALTALPASGIGEAPKDFVLERSDNGTTWYPCFLIANQTAWGAGEVRVFDVTGTYPGVGDLFKVTLDSYIEGASLLPDVHGVYNLHSWQSHSHELTLG